MRIPFAFLLAALFANLAAAQQTEFRVGTWNLEFLGAGGNYRENLPPRTDADLAAIGKKVHELGVCVLAVQEINDEATLQKVATGAGPSWVAMLGTSGGWDDGKTAQRIGFLYDRAAVELLYAAELLMLPREFESASIFHRVPVTACFQHKASGADFRLVTVHLKAGRKADDEKKRRGESTLLAGWIDQLLASASEDHDVILLGDFNSTYGTQPQQAFESQQHMHYLRQRQAMPTIMHFADPIDQVVVADSCSEVVRDSLAVDNDFDGMEKTAWRQIYSDHFPVTVTLRANGDDDPDAKFAPGEASARLPVASRPAAAGAAAAATIAGLPKPGDRIEVSTMHEGVLVGTLLRALPENGQGWLLLDQNGPMAIPLHNVRMIRAR